MPKSSTRKTRKTSKSVLPYRLRETRHGQMLVNPQDSFVGRSLMAYGEYSEIEWQLLSQLIHLSNGWAIEIGAHCGALTLPIAKALATQQRRLLALEPQPIIFQQLCANLALNGLMNVTALPFACGAASGLVHMPQVDYQHLGNFGGVSMREGASNFANTVHCTSIDALNLLEPVGLIKIDVEGSELSVLLGAEQALKTHRPLLYVENDRLENSKTLIEWLWQADYLLWWHMPPLFNPKNHAKAAQDLFNVVSINLLGIPAEKNISVKDLIPVLDSARHPLISGGITNA